MNERMDEIRKTKAMMIIVIWEERVRDSVIVGRENAIERKFYRDLSFEVYYSSGNVESG